MDAETRNLLIDHALNWFVFTPLIVAFWYGTYILQDLLLFNLFESRFFCTLILLLFGVTVEICITVYQDEIADYVKKLDDVKYVLFSRGYNYLLSSANIAHYRAIQEIYDAIYGAGDFSAAVQTSVTSIIVLWSLRAGRNITAAPFTLSLDHNHNDWFKAPTLYGVQHTRRYGYIGDILMTVLVVWSLAPLHWVALTYVFDLLIFPNNYAVSVILSTIIGYSIVALFSYFQHNVKAWSEFYDGNNRWISKTALENIYIWGATTGVIMSWKGLGMFVDSMAKNFPLIIFGTDFTGLAASLIPFLILSACYVSGCLVAKGAEMDGSIVQGCGVDFSRSYCKHMYEQFFDKSGAFRKKLN